MKKLLGWAVVSAFMEACSSSSAVAPQPATCTGVDHLAAYKVAFGTETGTCGALTKQLLSVDSLDPDDAGIVAADHTDCVVRSSVWSEGNCKLTRSLDCQSDASTVTFTHEEVFSIRDIREDGGYIIGQDSVSSATNTGANCQSTFEVALVRQPVDGSAP